MPFLFLCQCFVDTMPDHFPFAPVFLNFRTPYKSQAESTAEKTTDGVSSSPLCVITNRPAPSTANGVPAATVFSSTGTDSSGESREKRRYEVPDAFAGLCSEMRDTEWVWSPWLTPQIELNFTVISYIGSFFFCGGGLIPDYLVLCSVCSQTLFYLFYDNCQEYICLLWCGAWSTEKERSFILFWVFCDRSVQQSNTVKKMSKKQSWVYSFIHVGIPPGKEMSVYGDAGLRPAVCSWDLLCSSG